MCPSPTRKEDPPRSTLCREGSSSCFPPSSSSLLSPCHRNSLRVAPAITQSTTSTTMTCTLYNTKQTLEVNISTSDLIHIYMNTVPRGLSPLSSLRTTLATASSPLTPLHYALRYQLQYIPLLEAFVPVSNHYLTPTQFNSLQFITTLTTFQSTHFSSFPFNAHQVLLDLLQERTCHKQSTCLTRGMSQFVCSLSREAGKQANNSPALHGVRVY